MAPGRYLADGTEGITRVEDLPPPLVVFRSRNYRRRPCPLEAERLAAPRKKKRQDPLW
jgi:hypothetical protein